MLFLNSWRASVILYTVTTHPPAIFKNSIGTQENLRLNLHSLSVSELLEYRRKCLMPCKGQLCPIAFYTCLTANLLIISNQKMSNFHFDLSLKLSQGEVHDFSGEV
jgi:hypothetical protein